tara:strand:+ start:224 stop:664 length:441 start_codon:yes stop_codon:yes gene_type:complete
MRLIRKAKPSDVPEVVRLGLEALKRDAYENLRISETKVVDMAKECISAPCHFCWVAEKDSKIVGAVSAMVHPMAFYERSQASVVQFYCEDPGQGVKLIREFLAWAKSRPAIKMVCFTLECKADKRIGKLLSRLGLENELPVYMSTL